MSTRIRPQSWIRIGLAFAAAEDGNAAEMLWSRGGNIHGPRSTTMAVDLNSGIAGANGSTYGVEGSMLMLQCACGAAIKAEGENELVRLARLHLDEFHPDLSGDPPTAVILAMAEQKGPP